MHNSGKIIKSSIKKLSLMSTEKRRQIGENGWNNVVIYDYSKLKDEFSQLF